MKIHQLRDFVAVARLGGIRPAARALALTQPGITKNLQQLEAQLEVPLFHRSGRGLKLTKFGEALFARTQAVMNDLERAEDEIRQMRSERYGHVSFSMGGVNLVTMLPGSLATFQRRHPDVTVRVVERSFDDAVRDLRSGVIDFAVMPDPPRSLGDDLTTQDLLRDTLTVIARRGHPLAAARSLAELSQAAWIVTRQGALQSAEFEAHFKRVKLAVPRRTVQCESIIGVLALIAKTDLLAILPRRWLRSEITATYTQEIALIQPLSPNVACVVRRSDLPLSPAAAAYVHALEVEATTFVA
ncbi:LysR substrate-binding domain-containing protein [Variovorax sp. J22P168]|uniref:LysR substrate-binding domain-containing protein n=1 Tax=Variovorax jilinensis TaxID=3053513 RepID=UPI00257584EF|nr:LysR substrate-binding domain-containing protein [Variovorax sp. J22P168]MDM0014835.1 LysR substrate-binding domain-containing protein [Variovorax sp. J22P168]